MKTRSINEKIANMLERMIEDKVDLGDEFTNELLPILMRDFKTEFIAFTKTEEYRKILRAEIQDFILLSLDPKESWFWEDSPVADELREFLGKSFKVEIKKMV